MLDGGQKTECGETKWLCRCKCGIKRLVWERGLQYGGFDLAGRAFGEQNNACGFARLLVRIKAASADLSKGKAEPGLPDATAAICLTKC